jgi:hypothetical protein
LIQLDTANIAMIRVVAIHCAVVNRHRLMVDDIRDVVLLIVARSLVVCVLLIVLASWESAEVGAKEEMLCEEHSGMRRSVEHCCGLWQRKYCTGKGSKEPGSF